MSLVECGHGGSGLSCPHTRGLRFSVSVSSLGLAYLRLRCLQEPPFLKCLSVYLPFFIIFVHFF